MWYSIAPIYYVSRALEDGHALLFLLGGAIIIGALIYKKPAHWKLYAILTAGRGVGVGGSVWASPRPAILMKVLRHCLMGPTAPR